MHWKRRTNSCTIIVTTTSLNIFITMVTIHDQAYLLERLGYLFSGCALPPGGQRQFQHQVTGGLDLPLAGQLEGERQGHERVAEGTVSLSGGCGRAGGRVADDARLGLGEAAGGGEEGGLEGGPTSSGTVVGAGDRKRRSTAPDAARCALRVRMTELRLLDQRRPVITSPFMLVHASGCTMIEAWSERVVVEAGGCTVGHCPLVVLQFVHFVHAAHGRCSAGRVVHPVTQIDAGISFQRREVGDGTRVGDVVQGVHAGLEFGIVMWSGKGGKGVHNDLRVRGLALVEVRMVRFQMPDRAPLVTENNDHNEPEAEDKDYDHSFIEFDERQFYFGIVVRVGVLVLQVTELAARLAGKGGDVVRIVGFIGGRDEVDRGRCLPHA